MRFNTNLMNRIVFSITLFLLVSPSLFAQQPATGKPATTAPAAKVIPAPSPSPPPSDTAVENRLVALALGGPEYDASEHQNKINELQLKKTKATWLNLLSIALQLNDQSFKSQQTQVGQVAYVYPKWFFGLTIPLGMIFSQGGDIKAAKQSLMYSRDQQMILAGQIKASVLSKYKQYKLYDDLVGMEGELLNDVLAISTQAEESFKNGSVTVEAYIGAQRTKNEELVKLKNLQLQRDLVRIELERLIGVPLDDVLHPKTGGADGPLFRSGRQ
jgi:outer membrane protein TolC